MQQLFINYFEKMYNQTTSNYLELNIRNEAKRYHHLDIQRPFWR